MITLAGAGAIDSPCSGLLAVEFRAASNHFSPSIAFVSVDLVGNAFLDFGDVNVRAETEDVGVPAC